MCSFVTGILPTVLGGWTPRPRCQWALPRPADTPSLVSPQGWARSLGPPHTRQHVGAPREHTAVTLSKRATPKPRLLTATLGAKELPGAGSGAKNPGRSPGSALAFHLLLRVLSRGSCLWSPSRPGVSTHVAVVDPLISWAAWLARLTLGFSPTPPPGGIHPQPC